MTAEQLRNSILQEAISGRLVPQDPKDEPASALLERFDTRRAELIADGKVKPKDNLPLPINEDEIPFELPSGWCWCRIARYTQKVTDFVASGSFASLRENVKYYDTPNYAILVRTKDFRDNFTKDLVYTDKHGYEFLENSRLFGGEMILPNIGASIGKVFIVPELPFRMTLAPNAIMTRFFYDYQRDWLYYFFASPLGKETLNEISSATAQGKFNKTEFKQILFPLPPLSEQQRIIAKLEELLPIVEQYGKAQAELDQLNAALPERLRQSILQEAMQGRLVPQNENESVEDLEKLIKERKSALIKRGELEKRYAKELVIDESEFEIDLPKGWSLCKLGNIARISAGGTPARGIPAYWSKGTIPWLKIADITASGKFVNSASEYITEAGMNNSSAKLMKKGTLLYTIFASIGEVGILNFEATCNQAIANIDLYVPEMTDYIYYYLKNLQAYMYSISKGCAQLNINQEILKNAIVPLPPLQEQQRIVAKIEELFAEMKFNV